MTAQQLKNSILQMAVQGKLVPQDPNDEPASVLLERIRAEKEQLIKEKKIRKEKNPSIIFRGADNLPYEKVGKNEPVCIADEIPFEIPDSWEWVRLGSIGETNIGLTYKPTDVCNSGIGVLRSNNIQNGMMDYSDLIYVSCDVPTRAMAQKGDILICARNGSRALVGKSAIVDRDGMAFGAFMAIFRSICNPYIQLFINSYLFRGQLDGATTTTINQVTQSMLRRQLCPLPPLEEQKRIVEKYKELSPLIIKYEKVYTSTTKLQNNFPAQLRRSILQWAVQGKLVPQDPSDEPAEVLLERIRAEKQKLIKEGKIKKNKHESIIFRRDNSHYEKCGSEILCIDEEIPFDLPTSWQWERLINIYNFIDYRGKTPTKTDYGVPLVTAKNVKKGYIDYSIKEYISHEEFRQRQTRGISHKGDILFSTEAPMGNAALADINEFSAGQRLITFQQYGECIEISNELMMLFILSDCFQNQLSIQCTGTTVKGIKAEKLKRLLIPIPPLAEQQRILNVIKLAFEAINTL
jgi:type I restriction enzyme S subunit